MKGRIDVLEKARRVVRRRGGKSWDERIAE